jgi:hypothetical protein
VNESVDDVVGQIDGYIKKQIRTGLVPKKVQVTRKDGTTYMQTRWMRPTELSMENAINISYKPELLASKLKKLDKKALIHLKVKLSSELYEARHPIRGKVNPKTVDIVLRTYDKVNEECSRRGYVFH